MAAQTFYVARRFGRMANRLVLAAHLAAYVREHRHRVINYTLHSYAHLFEHLRHDLACRFPMPATRWLGQPTLIRSSIRRSRLCYHTVRYIGRIAPRLPMLGRRCVSIDDKATDLMDPSGVISLDHPAIQLRLANKSMVFVDGWHFRASGLLAKHAAEVRDYLRPVTSIAEAAQRHVGRLREGADVVVGIHRRKGDYRTWLGGRYYFDDACYRRWMDQIAAQHAGKRVAFLVCSDEALLGSALAPHKVAAGLGSPLADMTTLSLCDKIIGPVSTFSQWASFAGDVPLMLLTRAEQSVEHVNFQVSRLDVLPGITPDSLVEQPRPLAA